jgi:hypothetical protein
MGGYKHTGVGDATARNHYLGMGQGQDLSYCLVTGVTGTNNLTGTMPGWTTTTPAGYPSKFLMAWVQPAANTGAVTWNLGGRGAKTLLSRSGGGLVAGDLPTGSYNIAYYDGTNIVLLTDTTSTAENGTQQSAMSGYLRPAGGLYTAPSSPGAGQITVPAGSGRINTVGDLGAVQTQYVEWDEQTVTLDYLATEYYTVLMVDSNGAVVQFAGTVPNSAYREYIYICDVAHPNGSIEAAYSNPAIYGDGMYLLRDYITMLGPMLVSGGKLTENSGAPLDLDISEGVIFLPSGDANTAENPNLLSFAAVPQIPFYTQSGADYLSGPVTTAPVTEINIGGANAAATVMTNATDATIHRLVFRTGVFYWVYGQTLYTSFANALAAIEVDRSTFLMPAKLNGATLIAEIIATKGATDFSTPTTTAIISYSGKQYYFGSANSILDAPGGGLTYGRNSGNWVTVIGATSPTITTDATISGTAPQLNLDFSGAPTGFAGIQTISSSGFDYVSWEVNQGDDDLYLRSRNPADGVLRYTWQYNLATGATTYPGAMTVGALTCGAITSSGDGTFNGTGAVQLSRGTTAQRPGIPGSGMIRYNESTGEFEGYGDSSWGSIGGGSTSDLFYENAQTIDTNVTLTADRNSMTAGPITIADGVTVTIPDGANWVIV